MISTDQESQAKEKLIQESDGDTTQWASFHMQSAFNETVTQSRMIEMDEHNAFSDGGEDDSKQLLRPSRINNKRMKLPRAWSSLLFLLFQLFKDHLFNGLLKAQAYLKLLC